MPSKSRSQQRCAGMALAAKRGKVPAKKLKGSAREMYDDMGEDTLDEYARTKHKGLPKHVKDRKLK